MSWNPHPRWDKLWKYTGITPEQADNITLREGIERYDKVAEDALKVIDQELSRLTIATDKNN